MPPKIAPDATWDQVRDLFFYSERSAEERSAEKWAQFLVCSHRHDGLLE